MNNNENLEQPTHLKNVDSMASADTSVPNSNELLCDYAYKDIKEYEDITGIKVNTAFKIGWDMARATMKQLNAL